MKQCVIVRKLNVYVSFIPLYGAIAIVAYLLNTFHQTRVSFKFQQRWIEITAFQSKENPIISILPLILNFTVV